MSRAKSKVARVVLFLSIFIAGVFAGALGCGYQYRNIVLPYCAEDYVGKTASILDTVSMLRLDEKEEAILYLENIIDQDTIYINGGLYNGIKTESALQVLSKVRTYRDHYPSMSEDPAKVTHVLAQYPPVTEFKCKTSLCRLVEKSHETD